MDSAGYPRPMLHAVLAASASDIPAAPVVGLMAFGVVIAVLGHSARNTKVAGVGIAVLFVATALMVIVGYAAYNDNPNDPRDCAIPQAC